MFWSFCYLVLRCVFQLVFLRPRSEQFRSLRSSSFGTSSLYFVGKPVDRG